MMIHIAKAYEELYHKLLSLIEDYPGVWSSYDSVERKELLQPKLLKYSNVAHAIAWIVYEQSVDKIHDNVENNDTNRLRINQERNLLLTELSSCRTSH
eukprot:1047365-Pyramimonas_sp.AAC.1